MRWESEEGAGRKREAEGARPAAPRAAAAREPRERAQSCTPARPSEGEDKAVWRGHRLQRPLINRNDPVEMPGLTFGRLLLALGLGLAMCLLLIRNIGPQAISLGALPSAVLPPFLAQSSPHGADLPPTALGKLKRVAIVGAGASGSAAAFFLERAARSTEGEGEIELVVFERDARVGGRSTTVQPYGRGGPEGEGEKQGEGKDVELGASIFVSRPAVPGSCLQQSAALMLTPMVLPPLSRSKPSPSDFGDSCVFRCSSLLTWCLFFFLPLKVAISCERLIASI